MSVYRHLTLTEREYMMVRRARGRSITAIARECLQWRTPGEVYFEQALYRV